MQYRLLNVVESSKIYFLEWGVVSKPFFKKGEQRYGIARLWNWVIINVWPRITSYSIAAYVTHGLAASNCTVGRIRKNSQLTLLDCWVKQNKTPNKSWRRTNTWYGKNLRLSANVKPTLTATELVKHCYLLSGCATSQIPVKEMWKATKKSTPLEWSTLLIYNLFVKAKIIEFKIKSSDIPKNTYSLGAVVCFVDRATSLDSLLTSHQESPSFNLGSPIYFSSASLFFQFSCRKNLLTTLYPYSLNIPSWGPHRVHGREAEPLLNINFTRAVWAHNESRSLLVRSRTIDVASTILGLYHHRLLCSILLRIPCYRHEQVQLRTSSPLFSPLPPCSSHDNLWFDPIMIE